MEHGGNAALKQVSRTSGTCQSFALAVGISSSLVRRWDSMLLINLWSDVILHVFFCMRNKNNKNLFVNSFVILDAECCKNWIYLHVWEKWRALGKGWICPLPEQGPCCVSGQCPVSPLLLKDKDIETIFSCVSLLFPTMTGQSNHKHGVAVWGQVMWSTLCFCLSYCMLQEDNDEGVFHSKGNKANTRWCVWLSCVQAVPLFLSSVQVEFVIS